MRKIASLLSVLMLVCALAFGQTRTVSGTVRDDKGDPIPFATVTVVGTNTATQADASGNFSINVAEGARLSISSTGFAPQTIDASGNLSSIALVRGNEQLAEVVVNTAFGIRRSQRVTPYSAQTINQEQLRIIPQTNVNTALAGKVAGAQFRGQSPIKLNDQGFIRMRGSLGLTGDQGALYIVDGTPITNAFDLNPDDIEDLTVLKGANATALFGERARGGAVVITTRKRGAAGTAGIEISHGITFDRVYILPKYQNLYAGGSTPDLMQFTWGAGMPEEWKTLDGKYFHDYTDDASWGPRMVGQEYVPWYSWIPGHKYSGTTERLLPQKNNARDFWNTGVTSVTNAAFSQSGKGYNVRISYTNNAVKGMLPNTRLDRNNVFTAASFDLNQHFNLATNINFNNSRINGEFNDDYSNQSTGSFNQWFHRNVDMNRMKELRALRSPTGTYASWNFRSNPDAGVPGNVYRGNYWYNFFTYFDLIDQTQTRDRLFGDVSLTYTINPRFKLRGTIRKNTLNTNYENIDPSALETSAAQSGFLSGFETGQTRYNEMNYEFVASYNDRYANDKLILSLNAGGNVLNTRFNDVTAATAGGLNIPDFYAISNSKNQPTIGNARQASEVRSGFAFGDLEWNRIVAFNFAVRNDWYSTLPLGNNSLLSPSAGLSFFFTDFTKNALPWLSYGKVFASWGKKPLSLEIYQNNFAYTLNQNQWNGNFLMTAPNQFIDPSVKGALITTYEAGFDFRFIQNRYGVTFTYYDESQSNPPIAIPTSGIGGFTSSLSNATQIERRGIELELTARPMVRKDFEWQINKTFGYLIANPVKELIPGQDRILLAGGAFGTRFARAFQEKGKDWGQLIGGGIKRNEDGLPLIDTTMSGGALYINDADKHWGSVVPKITGGLVNTLTFKNFTFNFNIDYQFGGKFFSLSEMWGHFSGLLEGTAATNDKGMNVRDAVSDGGGVHVVGVAADGKTPVDMYVDAQTYFHSFYFSQVGEPFVHSLSYVKLREVSIGYRIPVDKMSIGRWFKGATASIISRNPLLIYRETRSFDPSEISGLQGENGQYPGTRSLGFNLKLNF